MDVNVRGGEQMEKSLKFGQGEQVRDGWDEGGRIHDRNVAGNRHTR